MQFYVERKYLNFGETCVNVGRSQIYFCVFKNEMKLGVGGFVIFIEPNSAVR